MKKLVLLSFLLFMGMQLMAVKPAHAPVKENKTQVTHESQVTHETTVTHTSAKKEGGGILSKLLKKSKKLNKLVKWVKTKVFKKAIDLDDPVMKWLWYAIFLAAASIIVGILSTFIPFIWIVGSLLGLGAAICLVYWLILYMDQ